MHSKCSCIVSSIFSFAAQSTNESLLIKKTAHICNQTIESIAHFFFAPSLITETINSLRHLSIVDTLIFIQLVLCCYVAMNELSKLISHRPNLILCLHYNAEYQITTAKTNFYYHALYIVIYSIEQNNIFRAEPFSLAIYCCAI